MIYFNTKLYMPSSSDASKLKMKYKPVFPCRVLRHMSHVSFPAVRAVHFEQEEIKFDRKISKEKAIWEKVLEV